MLSKELEFTLNIAFREAREKRHEFMTVEHLLLALLDNNVALDVLKKVGADVDRLRSDLNEFIDSTTPLIPAGDSDRETQPTLGFQRVLQRAGFRLELHNCVVRGERIAAEDQFISIADGGVVCPACGHDHPRARPVSMSARAWSGSCWRIDWARCLRVASRSG